MPIFENFPYTNLHELNLDWLIKTVKEWSDHVKEYMIKFDNLEEAFNDLKAYIDNYFDNLDVQDEINNKLQDMLESGELEEIIAQFLQSESLIVFNTLSDMVNADNLINGLTTIKLGNTAYNDGDIAIYRIRTLTSGDTIDNYNIVALTNYPTLIAERLSKSKDYMIVFGDSWSDTSVAQNNWFIGLSKYLNLNYVNYAVSGATITSVNPDNNIDMQITRFNNDNSYMHQKIKYIFLLGGLNDYGRGTSASNLYQKINSLYNQFKNILPDAEFVYISNSSRTGGLLEAKYFKDVHDFIHISNTYKTLRTEGSFNTNLWNDSAHLNSTGQIFLSNMILATVTGNKPSIYPFKTTVRDTANNTLGYIGVHITDTSIITEYRITLKSNVTSFNFTADDAIPYVANIPNIIAGLTKNYYR